MSLYFVFFTESVVQGVLQHGVVVKEPQHSPRLGQFRRELDQRRLQRFAVVRRREQDPGTNTVNLVWP